MPVDRLANQSIAMYDLEQLVGQDALTETYLAFDPELRRHVLIRLIASSYAESGIDRQRYLNRVNSLAQIRHPNIATIYNTGETADNRIYIVFEHIEGFPLADRLHRLAEQQSPTHSTYALTLIRQIASGLSLAERLGYFHYELTPKHILLRNVTLKTDDSAVLVNLDILPILNFPEGIPSDVQRDCYLSPEQRKGREIDSRSQVYSLGTILLQLLTGNPPDCTKSKWQRSIQTNGFSEIPLKQVREDLAAETYELVEKSLRTRPSGRYGSMSEYVGALDIALAAEDLRIHITDMAEPQRPRPFFLAPLLLLFLCVATAVAMWWFNPGNSGNEPYAAPSNSNSSELLASFDQARTSPTPTRSSDGGSPVATIASTTVVASTPSDRVASLPAVEFLPTDSIPATITLTIEPPPSATPTYQPATSQPPAATEVAPTPPPEYRISVSSASLRRGPGTQFDVNSYLLHDEVVVILAKIDGADTWYVVETTDGKIGWISASVGESLRSSDLENVKKAATVPAPPPTFTPTATLTPLPTDTPFAPLKGNNGGNNSGDKPKSTPTPPL